MITLTPAYGRDYKNLKDLKKDFFGGKDFILNDFSSPYDGKPCSVRDFKSGEQLKLRYNRLTRVTVVTIP